MVYQCFRPSDDTKNIRPQIWKTVKTWFTNVFVRQTTPKIFVHNQTEIPNLWGSGGARAINFHDLFFQ